MNKFDLDHWNHWEGHSCTTMQNMTLEPCSQRASEASLLMVFFCPPGNHFHVCKMILMFCQIWKNDVSHVLLGSKYTGGWAPNSAFPMFMACPRRGYNTITLVSQSLRGGGLINFSSLTLQVIKVHPVISVMWLIIWGEFFFLMMSIYGINLRDRGSITYHARLL